MAPHWSAWTKVVAAGRDTESVYEYLRLQRFLWGEAASQGISLIRLEQRLWQKGRA